MKPLLTQTALASLSHKVFSAEQVRCHEPQAAKLSDVSMCQLMLRAGQATFDVLKLNWPDAQKIQVVVGAGNNGGDGFVVATLARREGLDVVVSSPVPDKALTGDALTAYDTFVEEGGEVLDCQQISFEPTDVIVDGLLGTGLSGEVRSPFIEVIEKINQSQAAVLSIDIPSGIHADTGQVLGNAVQAQVCVTFVGIKSGLVTATGKAHCGHLVFDDLQVGDAFDKLASPLATRLGFEDFEPLPKRALHAHKGSFGRLLCIGGNRGMAGAIRLSSEAALRCGAGLVKVFCHHESRFQVSNGRPELMISSDNLAEHLTWADCLVLGPGMGQDAWSRGAFNEVLAYLVHEDKPVVIDADGLNLLSHHLQNLKLSNLVITPHPAEAARLLGCATSDVEQNRYHASASLGEKFTCARVLKGAGSLIGIGNEVFVCSDGNPGMATAGMGDVLSGVIGAMLAQGMDAGDASLFATCLHGVAGDLAAENGGQRGMLAGDVFPHLRMLLNR